MGRVQSEYEVEIKFIERLESIGYEYDEEAFIGRFQLF